MILELTRTERYAIELHKAGLNAAEMAEALQWTVEEVERFVKRYRECIRRGVAH